VNSDLWLASMLSYLWLLCLFVGACLNLLASVIFNFSSFLALCVPVVSGILSCGASIDVPTNSVCLTRRGCYIT
jgi:hypothetical protein